MIYIISYFQAGGSQRGSSRSSNIGTFYFKDKICFKTIRKTIKGLVLSSIESNCPCINELKVFYNVTRIQNDEITGTYRGNIKSTDTLKWKTK